MPYKDLAMLEGQLKCLISLRYLCLQYCFTLFGAESFGGKKVIIESTIKWHKGEPKEIGEYIVTTLDGLIDYDVVYRHSDGDLFWGFYDNILAWCKLSNIEPYKDETNK